MFTLDEINKAIANNNAFRRAGENCKLLCTGAGIEFGRPRFHIGQPLGGNAVLRY